MENKDLLTIGELAARMDSTVRTLQYYDKEDLLKPSARSKGGRRLYGQKDIVKLHQILSMKFLGFSLDEIKSNLVSLDTPKEVINVLIKQKDAVRSQIESLTSALSAIDALLEEVHHMNEVNFSKYADIISLLRLKNEGYWIVKFFDDKLMTHIKDKYSQQPDKGLILFKQWESMCDEIPLLKAKGVTPSSKIGQELARKWWDLVMEFTGGDMSMLPELIKFNQSKDGWSEEMKKKQLAADGFIETALAIYFEQRGIQLSEMEGI